MKHTRLILITTLLCLFASINPAMSAERINFTLTAQSTFVIETPQSGGRWLHSIFRNETYPVVARTKDSQWIKLDPPGGWVLAQLGTLSGNIKDLPIYQEEETSVIPVKANPLLVKGVPLTISTQARNIYYRGLANGNNPHAFSKIGDCNSVAPFFLVPFDVGEYRLGQYVYLQETINNFSGSFSRESITARIGFSTESIFDLLWSDPKLCNSENPLECEYRLHRPSIAFISLGTNGAWLTNDTYEKGMRQTLNFLIARGVLPILSTKADSLDDGRFNPIIIQLSKEYDLPLWDFRLAVSDLENFGLSEDQFHLTWGQTYFDRPLYAAWQWRNLTALQTLDIVWRNTK